MEKAEIWLKKAKEGCSVRDYRLLERSVQCLIGNVISGENCVWKDRKIVVPSVETYFGAWNWDSAFIAKALAYWDVDAAYEQCELFFNSQRSDGMFADIVLSDGRLNFKVSKPPIFFTTFLELCKRDSSLLTKTSGYETLKKNEEFWVNCRCDKGLFYYSSVVLDEHGKSLGCLESGWDNSVRWDNGCENLWTIDLNCYMYLAYVSLSECAKMLNRQEECELYQRKADALKILINERLWNEELQCYTDVDKNTLAKSNIISPASFMPLFVGIATPERAAAMKVHAEATDKFYPLMPTVSYDNPNYNSAGYWRGPMWLNTAYFAAKGLKNYGYIELAEKIKDNILTVCDNEKEIIFEYYDSITGKGLGAKQFAWSAAFIIEFILNF